jgi:hypothetical protein
MEARQQLAAGAPEPHYAGHLISFFFIIAQYLVFLEPSSKK